MIEVLNIDYRWIPISVDVIAIRGDVNTSDVYEICYHCSAFIIDLKGIQCVGDTYLVVLSICIG